MSAATETRRILRELSALGDPERAAGAKRYLKSDLRFLGLRTPELRSAVKAWLAKRPELSRENLLEQVRDLWGEPVHELRAFAIELLYLHSDLLRRGDLRLLEKMLRESGSWAYVDAISIHLVGPLVERYPGLARTLDRWAGDRDFWIRRSAMLALLLPLRRGAGDWKRFTRYADEMLEEKEFFIRKAIGWVLREVSKKDPERVRSWLAGRRHRMSGVTLREAEKYLRPAKAP